APGRRARGARAAHLSRAHPPDGAGDGGGARAQAVGAHRRAAEEGARGTLARLLAADPRPRRLPRRPASGQRAHRGRRPAGGARPHPPVAIVTVAVGAGAGAGAARRRLARPRPGTRPRGRPAPRVDALVRPPRDALVAARVRIGYYSGSSMESASVSCSAPAV